jgi:hypothetical protein
MVSWRNWTRVLSILYYSIRDRLVPARGLNLRPPPQAGTLAKSYTDSFKILEKLIADIFQC